MRDFRDAKAMAQTLRDSLTTKAITVSHSESLELVSKMLGIADWNTLSALLQSDRHPATSPPPVRPVARERIDAARYPAVPLRDVAPLPASVFPLFVGREKTKAALDQAFKSRHEVVLVVQKDAGVDEPGPEDVLGVGVLAQLIETEQMEDGRLKVVVEAGRRVAIRRFAVHAGAYQADVEDEHLLSRQPSSSKVLSSSLNAMQLLTTFAWREAGRLPSKPAIRGRLLTSSRRTWLCG